MVDERTGSRYPDGGNPVCEERGPRAVARHCDQAARHWCRSRLTAVSRPSMGLGDAGACVTACDTTRVRGGLADSQIHDLLSQGRACVSAYVRGIERYDTDCNGLGSSEGRDCFNHGRDRRFGVFATGTLRRGCAGRGGQRANWPAGSCVGPTPACGDRRPRAVARRYDELAAQRGARTRNGSWLPAALGETGERECVGDSVRYRELDAVRARG